MCWNEQRHNGEEHALNDGFQRMKSKRSPRRWVRAFVMHQMHVFEDRFPMHGAVRPVEIGIMQNDQHWNAQPKIKLPIFAYIHVDGALTAFDQVQREHTYNGKHNNGTQRVKDFSLNVLCFWNLLLDLHPEGLRLKQHVEQDVRNACKDHVPDQVLTA